MVLTKKLGEKWNPYGLSGVDKWFDAEIIDVHKDTNTADIKYTMDGDTEAGVILGLIRHPVPEGEHAPTDSASAAKPFEKGMKVQVRAAARGTQKYRIDAEIKQAWVDDAFDPGL